MQTYASTLLAALTPVILTKAGSPKRRLSLDERLAYLDPQSSREATLSRVGEFRRLFACRVMDGIVTERGFGPSAWTAYFHPIKNEDVISHLLANRIPGRPPIWYGSRSFNTSVYLCVDVDADRTPEREMVKKYPSWEGPGDDLLAAEYGRIKAKLARQKPRPAFSERCALVERAFHRMGVNPDNPYSVMIQRTPSGGHHYYVFFDAPYSLDQYHGLLHAVGLRHSPGEIEFFPSTKQGFRLPFGFIPGQPHDPHAWIQFIDDYRNGRIIRHTLSDLHNHLAKHQFTQYQRIQSRKKAAKQITEGERPKPILGTPKRLQDETSVAYPEIDPKKEQRYQELLKGIHSFAEAEELLDLGILVDGKRTAVLMHLAAHLIWFKQLSADDAAAFLTEWAMNPRHVSKDIADDLANGTDKVAKQITHMCRWHEANKSTPDNIPTDSVKEFSQQELDALRRTLTGLSPEERINQATFLLHFLRFAKRHPSPGNDGSAWEAAPAIRQVVRRWPGCHHMNYKKRISHAISAGCMTVVKEAWHRSNGAGRARTYRLFVPVVPEIEWVLTFEAALDVLTGNESPLPPSEIPSLDHSSRQKEECHASDSVRTDSGITTTPKRTKIPSTLYSACPGTHLDPRSRECCPQPHAAPGLHRRDTERMRTRPFTTGRDACSPDGLSDFLNEERRRLTATPEATRIIQNNTTSPG